MSLPSRTVTMKSTSSKMTPTPPPLGKAENEEIQRMNQDLNMLTQKLIDIQNASKTPVSTGSPFVNNIRDSASNSGVNSLSFPELKLQIMEKIITKMVELDRQILRNTEPVVEANDEKNRVQARRASRGLDLATFPTHLHIIDRLSDIHTKAQRVAVVIKNGGNAASDSPVVNTILPEEVKTQISNLENQIKKLTTQVKESEKMVETHRKESNQLKDTIKRLESDNTKEKASGSSLQAQLNTSIQQNTFALAQQQQKHEEQLKRMREEMLLAAKEANDKISAAELKTQKETNKQNENVSTLRTENQSFIEERLEIEINQKENLISALLSMSTKISNHCDTNFLTEYECQSVVSQLT